MQPMAAVFELVQRLRPPEQEHGDQRQFAVGDVERLLGPMPKFGDAAGPRDDHRQALLAQERVALFDGTVVVGRDRLPVVLLVAGVGQGVQAERVILWRRHVLFDHGSQDALFEVG